jgi:transitional endoplasmic reticulum ATPase
MLEMSEKIVALRLILFAGVERLRKVGHEGIDYADQRELFKLLGFRSVDRALKHSDLMLGCIVSRRLVDLENKAKAAPTRFEQNLLRLKCLGLNETELKVLWAVILFHTETALMFAVRGLVGDLNRATGLVALMSVTRLRTRELNQVLSEQSLLAKLNLVSADTSPFEYDLKGRFDLKRDDIADLIRKRTFSPQLLLDRYLKTPTGSRVALSSFKKHLGAELTLLEDFLRAANKANQKGNSILIYGTPGVGKSSLLRALAESLDLDLYELGTESKKGVALTVGERAAGLSMVTKLLMKSALVVVEEASDFFDSDLFGRSWADEHKAQMNALLEDNPVTFVWVMNLDPAEIDPAFTRRFSYALQMRAPSQDAKKEVLLPLMRGFSKESQESLLSCDDVTPGIVVNAARVARTAYPKDKKAASDALISAANASLKAMGKPGVRMKTAQEKSLVVRDFIPEAINMTGDVTDLSELVAGLRTLGSGSVLASGAPGTGKSELGRWLAKELGREFIYASASSLLSKYVGESEQNLSKLLSKAQSPSVVVLDEVDSIAIVRGSAGQSHMRSTTNALLTSLDQIEASGLVVLATTNDRSSLDLAVQRRFALMVELGTMSGPGLDALMAETAKSIGLSYPEELKKFVLQSGAELGLTPSDMVRASKKAVFKPVKTMREFLDLVVQGTGFKRARRPIGFIH